ncbi:MerR family transcriptional regulator [Thalassospira lucentensis]|uniref:MerR family transcriptional regulator n=1 Tax=Thalassospira lucentensis TaxID=168935 RepID=A0A358HZK0_9PROT|nr:MerR family transcriptional regulator [Thalassospira lucentensis]HBV00608.1 MerR family transcriptional regulator [Thalassospira lucentensis]HCW69310.1 MerR family transcriptional regulator [Thalassospira lucentensis]|tara:strand:+ start:2364 stop:2834 length:471 start_codon:yes stop_codon:yes gene_type:complete
MKTNLGAAAGPSRRTAKSDSAFRTISEAAKELGLQQHVLRFWESKFPQIQPMKRAGGRRYYRPEDIEFLASIRTLLHDQGFTIKGVQKLLDQNKGKLPGEITVNASDVDQGAVGGFASGVSSNTGFNKAAVEGVLGELQELQDILRASLRDIKKNP